jgi:hypothetical protein
MELVTANKATAHVQDVSDFLQIVGQPGVQLEDADGVRPGAAPRRTALSRRH